MVGFANEFLRSHASDEILSSSCDGAPNMLLHPYRGMTPSVLSANIFFRCYIPITPEYYVNIILTGVVPGICHDRV